MSLFRRVLAALIVAGGGVGQAQTTVVVADVGPVAIGRTLKSKLADPRTRVIVAIGQTDVAITRDSVYPGSLVILASRVTLTGQIHGDLIVVGGDLYVHPGAGITGRAIAIGGGVYPSLLAQITGGVESDRDFTFQAVRVGATVELQYQPFNPDPAPLLSYPGLSGARMPTYDRSNGLSVPYSPRITVDSGRIDVDPRLTYRSQLGVVDPSMSARLRLDRRDRVEALLGRGSFTNDRWITSDIMNCVRTIWDGRDSRNWYRADRAEAKLFRLWESPTGMIEPYLGGRLERAWSERPDSAPTGGPWTFIGRKSDEGVFRPNPGVTAGTISSALAGAHMTWDNGDIKSFLDGEIEVPVHAPNDRRFVQTTLDGQIAFPTFGSQRLRTDVHAVITAGDSAPPQRWAYLGGVGSMPTLDLLELGGDELLLIDTRYEIPLEGIKLKLLGSPTFAIRNALGSAAVARFPSLIESVGGRLSAGPFRIEVMIDTRSRKPMLNGGLSLTR